MPKTLPPAGKRRLPAAPFRGSARAVPPLSAHLHKPTNAPTTADDRRSATGLSPDSYYPWFDWLRFALANVVMLVHFGIVHGWPHAGDFAVQVFFALSRWLIGEILLEQSRGDLPRFFFNRAVRIWAPYYLALLFLIAASLLREPATSKWLEIVFYKATFVYNLFGTRQAAQHVKEMPLAGTGSHFWKRQRRRAVLSPGAVADRGRGSEARAQPADVDRPCAVRLRVRHLRQHRLRCAGGDIAPALPRFPASPAVAHRAGRHPARIDAMAVLADHAYRYAAPWAAIRAIRAAAGGPGDQAAARFARRRAVLDRAVPEPLDRRLHGHRRPADPGSACASRPCTRCCRCCSPRASPRRCTGGWSWPLLARRRQLYSPLRATLTAALAYTMVIVGVTVGLRLAVSLDPAQAALDHPPVAVDHPVDLHVPVVVPRTLARPLGPMRSAGGDAASRTIAAAKPATIASATRAARARRSRVEIVERPAPGGGDDRLGHRHRLEHDRAAAFEQARQDQGSASRSRRAQADCGSQPASDRCPPTARAASPPRPMPSSRASCLEPAALAAVAEDPEAHRRAGARLREGMQQQVDRLPVDQPAHVGEGGHRRRACAVGRGAAPARGSGRRRSPPARRRRWRARAATRRGCAGWRRAGSRRDASRASAD